MFKHGYGHWIRDTGHWSLNTEHLQAFKIQVFNIFFNIPFSHKYSLKMFNAIFGCKKRCAVAFINSL